MLRELLQTAARATLARPDDIARSLGVSRRVLDQMLDDLVARGYLRPVSHAGAVPCAGCPLNVAGTAGTACTAEAAGAAGAAGGTRLWAVTARGQALLRDAP